MEHFPGINRNRLSFVEEGLINISHPWKISIIQGEKKQ
jgi:hypothetical protein